MVGMHVHMSSVLGQDSVYGKNFSPHMGQALMKPPSYYNKSTKKRNIIPNPNIVVANQGLKYSLHDREGSTEVPGGGTNKILN